MDSKYITAFIDDKSRKIISYWFFTDKNVVSTAIALENTEQIPNNPEVFGIWTDNNTEFKGEFAQLLKQKSIKAVKTLPYNPEQKGKIEKFWKNIKDLKYEVEIGGGI
jgi:transposase InsO family protein